MMQTIDKKVIFAIFVFIIIFAAGILYMIYAILPKTGSVSIQTESSEPTITNTQQQATSSQVIPTQKVVITLTKNGFEPQTITVKTQTQIVWVNNSGADASINSNDHPTNSKYPPLNLGLFHSGESLSLVFGTPGTYGYHDYYHPNRTGIIIVE